MKFGFLPSFLFVFLDGVPLFFIEMPAIFAVVEAEVDMEAMDDSKVTLDVLPKFLRLFANVGTSSTTFFHEQDNLWSSSPSRVH